MIPQIRVRRQCELLELHRSGIYYVPCGESVENLHLMRKMDERHLNCPTEGVIQMQDYIRDEGLWVNHKRSGGTGNRRSSILIRVANSPVAAGSHFCSRRGLESNNNDYKFN